MGSTSRPEFDGGISSRVDGPTKRHGGIIEWDDHELFHDGVENLEVSGAYGFPIDSQQEHHICGGDTDMGHGAHICSGDTDMGHGAVNHDVSFQN